MRVDALEDSGAAHQLLDQHGAVERLALSEQRGEQRDADAAAELARQAEEARRRGDVLLRDRARASPC